ncbi:hypothetical protein [Pontixanthobacter luteolus]|uniref:hypothetical protein n=1 Tax=Pontixanthobacter luteolus TaxID=295089 RepID=UPI0023043CF4|nr:hypothetical protein [Pontixanthobacter luteolus]
MTRPLRSILLLASALPLLGGCVAAAIPVVAGGVMLGKGDKDKEAPAREEVAVSEPQPMPDPMPEPEPDMLAPADPVVTVGPVDELEDEEPEPADETASVSSWTDDFMEQPPEQSSSDNVAAELPAKSPDIGDESDAGEPVVDQPAPETEPNGEVRPAMERPAMERPVTAQPDAIDFRAYDVFYSYVEQQARRDPVDDERQSALLASPGNLSPRRTDCSIRPPAVLLDLDPSGGTFSLSEAQRPNDALAQILLSLRMQQIDVFWISQRSAINAAAIRKALSESGLDPQGRDSLLLMRRKDDRKQTRRREVGETHCLLAIAGDDRSDFDELYSYLKDKSAAQPLEQLIGVGWFLAPLPLTEGR